MDQVRFKFDDFTYTFEFDVPVVEHPLLQLDPTSLEYRLDLSNPNDLWFRQQHDFEDEVLIIQPIRTPIERPVRPKVQVVRPKVDKQIEFVLPKKHSKFLKKTSLIRAKTEQPRKRQQSEAPKKPPQPLHLLKGKIPPPPCPHPPRIQRQWEGVTHKNWYQLSPRGRVQAEKEMKQLHDKSKASKR